MHVLFLLWQHQLEQLKATFSCRKITGRVLASTKELLTTTAQQLSLHHLVNLTDLSVRQASNSAPG